MASLPPKVPGEHRWIAINTHTLTAGQARAAQDGSAVKLGPHNLVTTSVGCIDCETEWPAPQRCPDAASPEMDDVTAEPGDLRLTSSDQDRLMAAVDMIGRAGAKGFEVGHLEESVPAHLARWYASATFKGAKVAVEELASPVDAAEQLAWKLLDGGMCTHCSKRIGLAGHEAPPGACLWHREGDCWVPGCIAPEDVKGYIAERRRRRSRR